MVATRVARILPPRAQPLLLGAAVAAADAIARVLTVLALIKASRPRLLKLQALELIVLSLPKSKTRNWYSLAFCSIVDGYPC